MAKIHIKHALWLMPLILSCMMSAALSFANLLINAGWFEDFVAKWLYAWMLSWLIAFPLVMLFIPVVRKLLSYILTAPEEK